MRFRVPQPLQASEVSAPAKERYRRKLILEVSLPVRSSFTVRALDRTNSFVPFIWSISFHVLVFLSLLIGDLPRKLETSEEVTSD